MTGFGKTKAIKFRLEQLTSTLKGSLSGSFGVCSAQHDMDVHMAFKPQINPG